MNTNKGINLFHPPPPSPKTTTHLRWTWLDSERLPPTAIKTSACRCISTSSLYTVSGLLLHYILPKVSSYYLHSPFVASMTIQITWKGEGNDGKVAGIRWRGNGTPTTFHWCTWKNHLQNNSSVDSRYLSCNQKHPQTGYLTGQIA